MLKKSAAWLAAVLLLLSGARMTEVWAAEQPTSQSIPNTRDYETNAKGAVVLDAQTGRVLFAQNANVKLPMASTTKIMTALLTLEQEQLDDYFVVDTAAIHVEGSSMGLRDGDSASLRALAYGMLLPSGNDGANAAAVEIAGSNQAFAQRMNERAAEIGMLDTHFVTPSGLDDPEHYSTAYDMALLAREALQNPAFADICSQSKAVVQYGNPPYNRWLTNHNRLLRSYEGAVGVKTGFTKRSGRCLVSSASRNGIKLIAVTLGCPDDWNVHAKLYDRYFEKLTPTELQPLIPQVQIPVAGGMQTSVSGVCNSPPQLGIMQGEKLEVSVTGQRLLFAPVKKGEVVGSVAVSCDGEQILELPLTAKEKVLAATEEQISFFERLLGNG